jgi:hypothetical protein
MEITRNSQETASGPSDWFTGAVYIDTVAAPSGPSELARPRPELHAVAVRSSGTTGRRLR